MKLRELYSKPINRAVNPAVSATKFDPETEQVEIQEYLCQHLEHILAIQFIFLCLIGQVRKEFNL